MKKANSIEEPQLFIPHRLLLDASHDDTSIEIFHVLPPKDEYDNRGKFSSHTYPRIPTQPPVELQGAQIINN